ESARQMAPKTKNRFIFYLLRIASSRPQLASSQADTYINIQGLQIPSPFFGHYKRQSSTNR
ncbi:MAG: hypothetical protein VX876_04750, partial [Planctomycetota bacterium]|nr:hypothetical protein [Planctomycetota bacterium]